MVFRKIYCKRIIDELVVQSKILRGEEVPKEEGFSRSRVMGTQ
jgi:hypothetical protein